MPLITCPDCQREISDTAPACPGCGRTIRSSRSSALEVGLTASDNDRAFRAPRKRRGGKIRILLALPILGPVFLFCVALLNDSGAFNSFKTLASAMPSLNMDLEAQGEQLVRRLGDGIVDELGKASLACRRVAKIEAVTTSKAWIFSKKGAASLFISGQGDSVIRIDYHIESAGEKIYVGPKDPAAGQLSVFQFGLRGCS